jgi:tRNA threonylcarbamoyladenosine biosynthesis protein TsaB
MLLALDTSTSQASVALTHDERLLAELSWEVGRRHSQELPDRMSAVLRIAGARPADLTGVAVALGPGSFNGARVAVTTAKLLALTLGIPVYGAATLDAIAAGHAIAGGTLIAILDAGRGEVYAAAYSASFAGSASGLDAPDHVASAAISGSDAERRDTVEGPRMLLPGLWRASAPAIATPAHLADATPGDPLLCGEWRDETGAALRAAFGARARFAPRLGGMGGRRAVWLAALVAARLAAGATDSAAAGAAGDDPARLEPLYLRRPAITTSARPENQVSGGVATTAGS